MSDFDLVPNDGFGELQQYQPDTPLVPTDSEWLVPAPDFLTENQPYADAPVKIFGSDFAGTMQQAEQAVDQLGSAFRADAAKMKLDPALVNVAVDWLKSTALLPLGHVERRHKYNLEGFRIPKADLPAVHSFCNAMWRAGAPQRFVATVLWWLNEISKKAQQQSQQPSNPIGVTVDDLTDAEFAIVEKRAPADLANCEATLRAEWGYEFKSRLALVKNYIHSLPAQDRNYLETAVARGGILLLNDPGVIMRFYGVAIDAARVPTGNQPKGNALMAEIALIESKIGTREYRQSEAMQARLRYLYDQRDGG